jgi:hydroxypyruvate isomerase
MLRFCANLGWLFTEHAFLDRFAAAAKAGFKGVEFSQPYDHPAKTLARHLNDNGLEQAMFNLPAGDWTKGERGIACLPNRKHEFREGVKQAIDYAAELNCTRVNCLSGIAPNDVAKSEQWNTLTENLNFAAVAFSKLGTTLLLEPINSYEMPGFFLNTSNDALKAIAATGHPNIKLQYDIYHMQRSEGELAASITRLFPIIGHIQLADNPGRHEPGTGEINFEFLLKHIESLNYQGWIGCEYSPSGPTENSLHWMKM